MNIISINKPILSLNNVNFIISYVSFTAHASESSQGGHTGLDGDVGVLEAPVESGDHSLGESGVSDRLQTHDDLVVLVVIFGNAVVAEVVLEIFDDGLNVIVVFTVTDGTAVAVHQGGYCEGGLTIGVDLQQRLKQTNIYIIRATIIKNINLLVIMRKLLLGTN